MTKPAESTKIAARPDRLAIELSSLIVCVYAAALHLESCRFLPVLEACPALRGSLCRSLPQPIDRDQRCRSAVGRSRENSNRSGPRQDRNGVGPARTARAEIRGSPVASARTALTTLAGQLCGTGICEDGIHCLSRLLFDHGAGTGRAQLRQIMTTRGSYLRWRAPKGFRSNCTHEHDYRRGHRHAMVMETGPHCRD